MQGIVDDLLLLARADERGLRLCREDIDLDDIVDGEIHRTSTDPTIAISESVIPVRIRGDAAQISRMVRNLIDNALLYATTIVHAEVLRRDHDACLVVSDDGPGIPTADRARVFERFVRLDSARSRNHGGSGLGLAIVAEIVSAHHGSVHIESRAQGGTRVVLTLPADESPPASRS